MNNDLTPTEHFAIVDEILGDASTRYFGSGYRRVAQRVFDVRVDTRNRCAGASAAVTYPSSWSTKTDRELTPHLSSIDGFVIAAQLVETYLREAYGLDDLSVRECWIRRCTLKSGQAPTLELDAIPVSLALLETKPDPSSMCGYYSELRIKVGSLTLELLLDHPLFVQRIVRTSFPDVECCLGRADQHYLAVGYKHTRVGVSDLFMNNSADRARVRFDIDYDATRIPDGLSSDYFPFLSIPDALVGTAQLAQALLYRYDDITRATSRNLWMRKFTVDIPRPAVPTPGFAVDICITQANVLPIGDRRWRAAKFNVTLPSMTAEFSLAHELPEPALSIAV